MATVRWRFLKTGLRVFTKMRIIVLLLAFAALSAIAQIPTQNLAEQYNLISGVSGSTLTDSSGNSRNGTLHGTTPGATGVTCNGSSDWINLPSVISNNNFTVLLFAQSPDANSGRVAWGESDGNSNVRLATLGSGFVRDASGNGALLTASNARTYNSWHLFYLMREQGQATMGVWDQQLQATGSMGTSANIATNAGALCARNLGGSQDTFWNGTIAYVLIYTRALTTTEINAAYVSVASTLLSSSVYLPALPVINQATWALQRQGSILPAPSSEITTLSVVTNCKLISNPCVKAWYTDNNQVDYAESADGLSDWHIQSNVLAAHRRPTVAISGSTLIMLTEPTGAGANQQFDEYSSAISDGLTWTLVTAAVISRGAGGNFDATTINNPDLVIEGANWYITYDATGALSNAGGYNCGAATSTNAGATITKFAQNPITSLGDPSGCGGPNLKHVGAKWYLFSHGGNPASDIYLRVAASFPAQFSLVQTLPFLARQPFDEELTGTNGQIADPFVLDLTTTAIFYWEACPNAGGYNCHLKAALVNLPLSQMVLTTGGAASAP